PTDRIDHNLRVDINWLRRLTGSEIETRELLEQLMFEGTLAVDMTMLQSKFNMRQFFEKPFFPLSLYYLGMLTFEDEYTLTFPNLSMKTIFTEYFNEVERIVVSDGYTPIFKRYLENHDFSKVFAGYWKTYIGQIPAQAFDKANENFFRTTFYEICTRYLARKYIFSIEVNYPSGRADFEAIGRHGTPFADKGILAEFKHFSVTEGKAKGVLELEQPIEEDREQVNRYADDLQKKYPRMQIERFVIYTLGAQHYRFFKVNDA
ncbi:MAG: PD-(D/E)XK nuclease domain-containing protein, partial [Planctomycetes bacterium]|nr:PD-(D/E)XK nuclease domain-containing protein [Planctomycetota bacterium]